MVRKGLPALLGLCVAVTCITGRADVAAAHDSLAPPGAWHNWLPAEAWVHHRRIPFDEQALKHALGLPRLDLQAYLYNDHHVLAELARRRGIGVDELATRLIAPWQGISAKHRALLRERTLRILTQGHLAQHMFFHVFHGRSLFPYAQKLFGLPSGTYSMLRDKGLSYVQIAERGGVSHARLRAGLVRLIEQEHDDGLDRREIWPSQSRRSKQRTITWLSCWMRSPLPALDPTNPYGKNMQLHGIHAAGWPASGREILEDEQRVERFRKRLPSSCWTPPARWSWTGLRPQSA